MNELRATDEFNAWLEALDDNKAKNRILARLRLASCGDLGDCKPIGNGASEMRIHYGAGYRVYFFRNGATLYILLGGGTKRQQQKDIEKMLRIMEQIKNGVQEK